MAPRVENNEKFQEERQWALKGIRDLVGNHLMKILRTLINCLGKVIIPRMRNSKDNCLLKGGDLNLIRSPEAGKGANYKNDLARDSLETLMDNLSLVDVEPSDGKFDQSWLDDPECIEVIKEAWATNDPHPSPRYGLERKLINVKIELQKWIKKRKDVQAVAMKE
eukprot:Gb_10381 [translate_table: standard]